MVEPVESTFRSEFVRAALERYEAALVRYAFGITRDLETARDIVQDTFLKLCDQPPEAVDEHLAQWLFTVCRNRALDVNRKESRMTPLIDEQMERVAALDASPSAQAEQRDTTRNLLNLIDQLPQNQREVVRLKFQEQLSYEEIAAATSLSATNVGFLLHTAIRTLRARLAKLDVTLTPR